MRLPFVFKGHQNVLKPNTGSTRPPSAWGFCGTLRASIFLASSFFCSQAESTPAPAPQPAGLVRERKPLGGIPQEGVFYGK